MRILYEVLNELAYSAKDTFVFSCLLKEAERQFDVLPFVSADYQSQVYLVVQIPNADLCHIIESNFLISLAKEFRKQQFHRSEMDKNTTLLLECVREASESVNHLAKVQVEDDPFYFKKYVFSCSTVEENRAEEYLQNQKNNSGQPFSYIREIQAYLSHTDTFLSYKENHDNQPTYTYFSELVTKTPIFPLQITAVDEIKSVNDFLAEEFKKAPVPNVNALDQLLDLQLDFKEQSTEAILDHWTAFITN